MKAVSTFKSLQVSLSISVKKLFREDNLNECKLINEVMRGKLIQMPFRHHCLHPLWMKPFNCSMINKYLANVASKNFAQHCRCSHFGQIQFMEGCLSLALRIKQLDFHLSIRPLCVDVMSREVDEWLFFATHYYALFSN